MKKCEAGCLMYTGGEIKHHPDCIFYEESLTKMYDDLKKVLETMLSLEQEELDDDYVRFEFPHKLIRKANKLLNIIESELDEQQLEDKRIEELTERNVHIIGNFMEHCKENGLAIPDTYFESYFNA